MSEPPAVPTYFSDPAAVAEYEERTRRLVPGLADFHRICTVLLADRTPEKGRVLVVGAGGGLELRTFARAHPGWQFVGVDPAEEMLNVARAALGKEASRVQWHQGYVHDAPEGPFDSAACLLTLHFVNPEDRIATLREIHRRLAPGGAFVVMHLSFGGDAAARERWFARYVDFAVSSGVAPEKVRTATEAMSTQLSILPPDEDEAMLRHAGFRDVDTIYTGLCFRGWVGYA